MNNGVSNSDIASQNFLDYDFSDKKVLLIESKISDEENLKAMLKSYHLNVDCCKSCFHANHKLGIGNTYDVILLSDQATDLSPFEAIKSFEKIQAIPAPVIFIMSDISFSHEQLQKNGFDGVISRPFEIEELLVLLKNVFSNNKTIVGTKDFSFIPNTHNANEGSGSKLLLGIVLLVLSFLIGFFLGLMVPQNETLSASDNSVVNPPLNDENLNNSNDDTPKDDFTDEEDVNLDDEIINSITQEKNRMVATFPDSILAVKENIVKIYFQKDSKLNIEKEYQSAKIKANLALENVEYIRGWLEPDSKDSSKYIFYIKSDGDIYLTSGKELFRNFKNVLEISFENVNTSEVQSMQRMFDGCSTLQALDLSLFDTSNVVDMGYMFSSCDSLMSLDLSGFNTSSVVDMSHMFSSCDSLMSLDLSNFDTSNVADMSHMFWFSDEIASLNISSFDTKNVTDMEAMFHGMRSLKSLNLKHFDTSNVTNMNGMFRDCEFSSLDLSSFDTRKVTTMREMFASCSKLTSLNISSFDTSKVTDMSSMFSYCLNLENIDLTHFNTAKVTTMRSMFSGCSRLMSLDLSSFRTDNLMNVSYMFSGCIALRDLNVENFKLNIDVKNDGVFQSCDKLPNIDILRKKFGM